jgi:arylsulfatase A-like enzyme
VLFVFADQWRAQATGYAGDPNARTPTLDRIRGEGVSMATAVSSCPVCTPARASLLTGQYPLTHGLFMNDVPLDPHAASIARAFGGAGYDTGYIGKWHVDGHGWSAYVPPERRQGFRFWRGYELSHDYNHSPYWADDAQRHTWNGYDAEAQTRCAQEYIRARAGAARGGTPFFLMLSWGPPHGPYHTAPPRFRERYDPAAIRLRPNVPPEVAGEARAALAGYYAHVEALDTCLGQLDETLRECGLTDDTILVFTADHGDHLLSHGRRGKQTPWDEAALVPFLIRWPAGLGVAPREVRTPFATPDVMPTLLGLAGLQGRQAGAQGAVEGLDLSRLIAGEPDPSAAAVEGTLIASYHTHGTYKGYQGKDYRAIRTERHTYARTADGPWLLYDNERDPYQLDNLCGAAAHAALQQELDLRLTRLLARLGDEFLPGDAYLHRWGYEVDPQTGYSVTILDDLTRRRAAGLPGRARADAG